MDAHWWLAFAGIVGMDLLLSGDNAMVIALVCRDLPPRQRFLGMVLGTGAAIFMRIGMAFMAGWLLGIKGLAILGGLYLLWVAVKLTLAADEEHEEAAKGTLWAAIGTIALADASMSLDNVAAIAALSGGDNLLMALGILISIPLIIVGATLINWLLEKAPWLLWLGAILLGCIAGKVMAHDPLLVEYSAPYASAETLKWGLIAGGGALVTLISAVLKLRKKPEDYPEPQSSEAV